MPLLVNGNKSSVTVTNLNVVQKHSQFRLWLYCNITISYRTITLSRYRYHDDPSNPHYYSLFCGLNPISPRNICRDKAKVRCDIVWWPRRDVALSTTITAARLRYITRYEKATARDERSTTSVFRCQRYSS